jgi:hypothetical protein
MNKNPFNLLIATALGAVLWVATAIFAGKTFSESLMLAESTPDDFHSFLIIILSLAAGFGLLNTLYWFFYGNKESTAGKLEKAQKVWWSSFVIQIIISVLLMVVLVVVNMKEAIQAGEWPLAYVFISIHTWFFFWICTFFMSPKPVKYIPLFK